MVFVQNSFFFKSGRISTSLGIASYLSVIHSDYIPVRNNPKFSFNRA